MKKTFNSTHISSGDSHQVKLLKIGRLDTEEDISKEAKRVSTQLKVQQKKGYWNCPNLRLKLSLILLGFCSIPLLVSFDYIHEKDGIVCFYLWMLFSILVFSSLIIRLLGSTISFISLSFSIARRFSSGLKAYSLDLNGLERFYVLLWIIAMVAVGNLFGFWGIVLIGTIFLIQLLK